MLLMGGALSSVGRAEPLQGLGREFEPLSAHQISAIAGNWSGSSVG